VEHVDGEARDVAGIAVLHDAVGVARSEHGAVGLSGQRAGESDRPPGEAVGGVVRADHDAHAEHRGGSGDVLGDGGLGGQLDQRALLQRVVGLALAADGIARAGTRRPLRVVPAHPRDVAVGTDRAGEQRRGAGDRLAVGEGVEHGVPPATIQRGEVPLPISPERLDAVDGCGTRPAEDGDGVARGGGLGDHVTAEESATAEDEELHAAGYPS
jgi:hypothetical protein